MFRALSILLFLPLDLVPRQPPAEPWVTVTTVMLFVGYHAEKAIAVHWSGVESAPLQMPGKLSNWTCRRGGRDRGDQLTSYLECRAGDAAIVIDATCKTREDDADIGSAILLNKTRDYGGRFIITCMTARNSR